MLKELIGKAAPLLGTAIGGPVGGLAAKFISDALGLAPDATEQEVVDAVKKDPEAFVKLRKADNNFKIELRRLKIKEKELFLDDVKDARKHGSKTNDKLAYFAAFQIILIIVGTGYLLMNGSFNEISNLEAGIVTLLIRESISLLSQVFNYYFGSSQGSAEKNHILKG